MSEQNNINTGNTVLDSKVKEWLKWDKVCRILLLVDFYIFICLAMKAQYTFFLRLVFQIAKSQCV